MKVPPDIVIHMFRALLSVMITAPLARGGEPPAMIALRDVGGSILLSWTCTPGRFYQLEESNHAGGSWEVSSTDPSTFRAQADALSYRVTLGLNRRFYRIREALDGPSNPNPTRLVWIPAGTFAMGSPPTEPNRGEDEGPQTVVTISRGFWIGAYEVTQSEYLTVMGTNPSHFSATSPSHYTECLDCPVESVSWFDAAEYCRKLTSMEREAGRLPPGYEYSLPTEAQWEYACRAGTTTPTPYGDSLSSTQANFYGFVPYNGGAIGPFLGRTTKVGSYPPNAWGLYDTMGNVAEWCHNRYTGSLPGGTVTDPKGPEAPGPNQVEFHHFRGGGLAAGPARCRSAARPSISAGFYYDGLGFRVALVAAP